MDFLGTHVLARALSTPSIVDRHGNAWGYHSRSDRHSKIACWGVVVDLLRSCDTLRRHVEQRKVAFGINHEMRDFRNSRKKNLDLVICQPSISSRKSRYTLQSYAIHCGASLNKAEQRTLDSLPVLIEAPVGSVLIALEAKACMTAHQRALPRLYDELNSSHLTVHGAHDLAIAAGFVMINIAPRFLSPDLNKSHRMSSPVWNSHTQPKSVDITIAKVEQLPRRSKPGTDGYDALAIVVVDCANDGTPALVYEEPPAPAPGSPYHYASMIDRLRGLYDTRFGQL